LELVREQRSGKEVVEKKAAKKQQKRKPQTF
jgi:hypothetical protein